MRTARDTESWKRMVLRSQPKPSWLSADAPHSDVVLSSRSRIMRNLRGHRFPNRCETPELQEVMRKVLRAAKEANLELEAFKALTNAERDYLVGCRLVSPDFEWTLPGRALLMDTARSASMMINEEDHVRIQALTAGWSIEHAEAVANSLLETMESRLSFAESARFGYLSASPYNCGAGKRQSAMYHLIGLANAKRLPSVMKALAARGLVVRGLFGESSRAIGAFVQVSVVSGTREDFIGACEYLITEERDARSSLARQDLSDKATRARDFVNASRTISLPDALRVLAWVRWAASSGIEGFAGSARAVDESLTTLELRSAVHEDFAAKERAASLKVILNLN